MIAVGFLHSYAYPRNEQRVGELLREHLGDVPYSLSSDVVQEWREFPRFSTAVINAYVMPLLKRYVDSLSIALRERGYRGPIHFMASNGGVTTQETAGRYASRLILSGPAAGAMAGPAIGKAAGWSNVVTYDMGGTSTDVCFVRDFAPEMSSRRIIGAYPILSPMVDVQAVGAGGGSIAWIDATTALRVGPHSAGSMPGPACYGQGGTEFTVTDANLLLGRISPDGLLGGQMPLRRDRSEECASSLAQRVGMTDIYQLAAGVIQIVASHMAGAVRTVSIERGHDPREFALLAFGGAGGLHAIPIAEELGIPTVIVPSAPGNVCAMGLLIADLRHDFTQTYKTELTQDALIEVKSRFPTLRSRGLEAMRRDGVAKENVAVTHTLFLRYVGQAWELEVHVNGVHPNLRRITADFHRSHYRAYGYKRVGHPIELVNLGVTVVGRLPRPDLAFKHELGGDARPNGSRAVYFGPQFTNTPTYSRDQLGRGTHVPGPAVIDEFGATTLIFPGWTAEVDSMGSMILRAVSV